MTSTVEIRPQAPAEFQGGYRVNPQLCTVEKTIISACCQAAFCSVYASCCVCKTDIIHDNKSPCVGQRDGEDGLDDSDIWRDKGGEKQYFTDYTAAVLSEMTSDSR